MKFNLNGSQKESLAIVVFIVLPAAGFLFQEDIKDLFRLTGNNTVYDFQKASVETAVDWLTRQCNNGKCLDPIDWTCGFEFGDYSDADNSFQNCFDYAVLNAKPWTTLDTVRKYCGKRSAKFVGSSTGNPDRKKQLCAKNGGQWSAVSPEPKIDFN